MVSSEYRYRRCVPALDGANRVLEHIDATGAAIGVLHDPSRTDSKPPGDIDRVVRLERKRRDRQPINPRSIASCIVQKREERVCQQRYGGYADRFAAIWHLNRAGNRRSLEIHQIATSPFRFAHRLTTTPAASRSHVAAVAPRSRKMNF